MSNPSKQCHSCGGPTPTARHGYCSDACRRAAIVLTERKKRDSRRSEPKPCVVCAKPRPAGNTRYCSAECAGAASAERERDRQRKRRAACARCGGDKGDDVPKGGRYCAPCRQMVADRSTAHEYERSRRRQDERNRALVDAGEMVSRVPTYRTGEKWCARCQQYRALGDFPGRSGDGKRGAYCKPCQRSYNQERRLKVTFGITWDEYDFMLACQNYRCAICEGKPRKYALAVDHDHKTGELRGLLCSRCNHRLLGSANDDPARLRRAADYLEEYGPREVFGEPRYVPGFDGGAA